MLVENIDQMSAQSARNNIKKIHFYRYSEMHFKSIVRRAATDAITMRNYKFTSVLLAGDGKLNAPEVDVRKPPDECIVPSRKLFLPTRSCVAPGPGSKF